MLTMQPIHNADQIGYPTSYCTDGVEELHVEQMMQDSEKYACTANTVRALCCAYAVRCVWCVFY